MIGTDPFFEYVVVHGDMKGTLRTAVTQSVQQGCDALLEIDWQDARQVHAKVPDCQSIVILPPSQAELERRLRTRALDTADAIARRLRGSHADVAHAEEFDD